MVPLVLLLLAAVVASIALAFLRCEVTLFPILSLKLVYPLLQFAEVKLKIFVNLTHFKVLLLEILPALVGLT